MNNIPDDLFAGWDIIVIDDEPDSLEVASYILSFHGATIHTAEDGQTGLNLIQQVHPKFVISDLSMPVMDGWALIKALRENPATKDLPVFALTAHAMIGDREKVMAAGFHQYMSKPLAVGTFLSDLLKIMKNIPVLAEQLNL